MPSYVGTQDASDPTDLSLLSAITTASYTIIKIVQETRQAESPVSGRVRAQELVATLVEHLEKLVEELLRGEPQRSGQMPSENASNDFSETHTHRTDHRDAPDAVNNLTDSAGRTNTRQPAPRKKHNEVDRRFQCGFNGCTKSYSSISHLNTHIHRLGHGSSKQRRGISFPDIFGLTSRLHAVRFNNGSSGYA